MFKPGRSLWLCLCCTAMFLLAPAVHAASKDKGADKLIDIPLGGSQTVRVPMAVERIIVGDPQVCDVVPLPSGQLLLSAKSPGETQITVWARDGSTASYRVVSSIPVAALQAALRDAFPTEEDLNVRSMGAAVYLTGTVSDATTAEAAHRMANNLLLGSGRKVSDIINLTTVAAPHQVQLHLRFVEISRTNLRNLGFNAWYSSSTEAGAMFGPNQPFHYTTTGDTQRFVGPANPLLINAGVNAPNLGYLPIIQSPISGTFALSFASSRLLPISATLSLLEQKGVSKTLSEPTLVAMSGQEAKVLVGGEFPIPVPDALGHILIQFKSFGAQMSFTPTVVGVDSVHLKIDATVSDIDKSNGITLASVSVPALQTRQSSTSVRLRDGQSFALAGLLSDKITSQVSKMPILGEIPVVGLLFRSVTYTRQETELVILASVRMVKAMDGSEVPAILREDEFTDPNDLQLFLLGTGDLTHAPEGGPKKRAGSPEGAVGFSR